jgi:hypothetical protein
VTDLARLVDEFPGLGRWAILHVWRGSVANNMYVPSNDPTSIDDKDTMAVCVPPLDYYVGLNEFGSRGTQEIRRGEWDIVVYEARKALRMLRQGNPNILSMLWVEPNHVIAEADAGRLLRDNRDVFVGRHVYPAFTGYAYAQISKLQRGAYKGYMGEKRKAIVDRFGYDTKMAAHAIRLLRMGIEFLRDGELRVARPDREELLAIKRGEWTLERVQTEAGRLFRRAEDVYARSTLPARPDPAAVSDLTVEVVRTAFRERGVWPGS